MLSVPRQAFGGTTDSLPGSRRRGLSRRPDTYRRLNAQYIGQAQLAHPFAKFRVIAITGIGQHRRQRNSSLYSSTDLLQGNFRLGLETNGCGNSRGFAPLLVFTPYLWQIHTPGDGHTLNGRAYR